MFGNIGPQRNLSDFNEVLSIFETVYTKNLENDHSDRFSTESIRNGTHHRVLPPVGGNGVVLGGVHNNSQKVDI